MLRKNVSRGRVDVFIYYSSEREDAKNVVDMPLITAYMKAAKGIGTVRNRKRPHCHKPDAASDAVTYEDENSDEEALKKALVHKP